MERYLLTHSLLSSWTWTLKENPYETAEDTSPKLSKMDEFMMSLNRESIPTNEAMQNGIDFEDLVTKITLGVADTEHKWFNAASEIACEIKGAQLQYRGKKEVEVLGVPLLLYGRCDAVKAGVITDIKFSKKYAVGKFFDSTQHPMYMEICPEAHEFCYSISNGSSVFREVYRRDETPSIYPTIEQFLQWLESRSLMYIYKEKWSAL